MIMKELLDKDKISLNPGKRDVAKIKANSQWRYLAMNNNDAGVWF